MNLTSRRLFVCLHVHPPLSEESGEITLSSFDGESALRLRGRQIGEFAVPRGGRRVGLVSQDITSSIQPCHPREKYHQPNRRVIPKPDQVPQS